MLKVNNINVYYGKVEALFNVSFEVGDDEIVSLIGANGAGKTTLMKTIVGINRTAQGSIEYNGRAIHNQKPHKSIYDGIVYVPEGREVFPQMTVLENLEMGAFSKKYSKGEMSLTRNPSSFITIFLAREVWKARISMARQNTTFNVSPR